MLCFISLLLLLFIIYKYLDKRGKTANKDLRNKFKDIRSGKYLSVDEKYTEKIYNKKQELDRILDKISKKGISSLTKEEKTFLDRTSKK
jgi:hypothetical protein